MLSFDFMEDPNTRRIVLLGKTGAGKSSLVNTILGEEVFNVNHSANSGTKICQSETRSVNGHKVHIIDTPGVFDTDPRDKNTEPIAKCITECAPGPHAFLILLKIEKYTKQEKAIISVIKKYFSKEALKFATVVFTHGDQLPQEMKIEGFVKENPGLTDLVEKCGGRCHVFDNKYWNNEQHDEYRTNRFQIQELLKTIDKTVKENKEHYYTNNFLQKLENAIQEEEKIIRQQGGNMSPKDIREQAKRNVLKKIKPIVAGVSIGILLGGLLGALPFVGVIVAVEVVLGAGLAAAGAVGGGAAGGFLGFFRRKRSNEAQIRAQKSASEESEPLLDDIQQLLAQADDHSP